MSILASLVRAYDRLDKRGEVPPFGYSAQSIHGCIVLRPDGSLAGLPAVWHKDENGKKTSRLEEVPYFGGRSGTKPPPYFLWDNTAYVLGVTAKESVDASLRHEAFKYLHLNALSDCRNDELSALYLFLERWRPEHYYDAGFTDDLKDLNFVFRLQSRDNFVHQCDAAKKIWEKTGRSDGIEGTCLVTGERGPIARLHPPIVSFENPARIVSFNDDAYTSYEHDRGNNAPVSEIAAFKYTAALNRYLMKGSDRRIQVGDASTVFWADASDASVAGEAESVFNGFLAPNEAAEAGKVGDILKRIRSGVPLKDIEPALAEGVRFHVLGLAPNAARLSIRFWFEDDFGRLAENYRRFVSDMKIEPPPRDEYPALWKYLAETAVLGKRENVPPNLAGEWMRSILTGTRYPLTLLSTVLTRIRADGEVNALRVGMLRAVLVRNFAMDPERQTDKRKEAPVSLDPDNRNKGYLLGRLFAVYEQAQTAALGRGVNATIKDKFYGAASAQPRKVFSLLEKGSANHLSKVGKQRPGQRINLEKSIGGILEAMTPGDDPFPASLSAQEQALFGLGYYHQRNEFFRKPDAAGTQETEQ